METNKDIKRIIQDEIYNFAIKQLKNNKKENANSGTVKSDYDKIKELEEVDAALFYGGDNLNKNKINENQTNSPQITQSEIDKFQNDFQTKVVSNVLFSKKQDGSINFELYNGESGIEAKVSGIIPIKAENKIEWSFSLQNKAFVNVKAELNTEIIDLLNKLYFFFDSWSKEWTEKLTQLNKQSKL